MTFSRVRTTSIALLLVASAPMIAAGRAFYPHRTTLEGAPLPSTLLEGKVVGIQDGDTITLLDPSNHPYRIRLLGIDAPEKNQPFGKVAKQVLSDRIFGKQVQVLIKGQDRYGRTLGKVLLDGRDINMEMVRHGLAWFYKHYAETQFRGDAARYADTETAARRERNGLWAYPDPVEPWVWRKSRQR